MVKRSRGKNARPSKPKKKKQKVASPAVSEVLVDKAATASTGLSTAPPSDNERGEEQTVAYDPAEDFNERSNVRTELLTRIGAKLNNSDVPRTFWACCQVADTSSLERLIQEPRLDLFLRVIGGGLDSIPSLWAQRFRDIPLNASTKASETKASETKSRRNSDGQTWVQRSGKAKAECKKRDHERCVLTKMAHPEAAHIFPYCMLNEPAKGGRAMASDRIPKFWPLLEYFWETDRINNWRRTIFPDPQNPHTGIESCFNLISLCPNAHSFWSRGLFALKPLELSGDRKRLDIQFFWQPQVKSKADERLDLLTEPSSSRGLNSADECALHPLNQPVNIRSGDTFTLTTDDPESRPLPSLELLDMQWVLQRLVAMCGAAEWPWIEADDDSDHSCNYNYAGEKYPNICQWIPDQISLVSANA